MNEELQKWIHQIYVYARKYSDVVSGRREEACSSDDTHSWLRNYQRENETGKSHLDVSSK